MLLGLDRLARERLALLHLGQAALGLLVLGRIVAVLLVDAQVAVEEEHRTRRAQHRGTRLVRDIDRHLVEHRTLHLARDRAQPDELVEPPLIVVEKAPDLLRPPEQVRRTDRLMRLLRVLGRRLVAARLGGQIALAELLLDEPARGRDRLACQGHAVRAHVGDEPDAFRR